MLTKKKRIFRLAYFDVLADSIVKIKESEKIYKYLDITTELWNFRVTLILMVDSALKTVSQGLEKRQEDLEIRGRIETIQTAALLKQLGYFEES